MGSNPGPGGCLVSQWGNMPTPSSEKPLLQPARVLMSCHLASNDGALV